VAVIANIVKEHSRLVIFIEKILEKASLLKRIDIETLKKAATTGTTCVPS
jgi:hypothetical protein